VTTESRAPLAVFLGLTFGLSAVFWWLIVAAGSLRAQGGLYLFALMWCPGVSAIATRFLFHGGGTRGGRFPDVARWAGVAYVLPLGYGAVGYGAVWIARLGAVDVGRFQGSVLGFVVVGFLQSLLTATGEELGWRGFMVPSLARRTSFGWTALVSGVIWAAWHTPIIVLADYNAGTPAWYAVLCFAVGITSLSVPFAWLTLRSGSFWPAAVLHASHNLFVQGFFDVITVDTGWTRWLTGEFGASLAAALALTGWLFWRQGQRVESTCAIGTPVVPLSPAAASR
jgi:membrane protease YdiL (CAAX protease family)